MGNSTSTEIPPELQLAIRDEVARIVAAKTGDDRLFLRRQLTRLAASAKYIGLSLVAIVAVLGIKTIGDLHSVAENTVKSTIKSNYPATLYQQRIEELYRRILLTAGLTNDLAPGAREEPVLTDIEYDSILNSLLADDSESPIDFDKSVLLLRRAPYPIWKKAAASLLGATIEGGNTKTWYAKKPDRASAVLDALAVRPYSPDMARDMVRLRSLIANNEASIEVRAKVIQLATVVSDTDSARQIEQAYRTGEGRIREKALEYLVKRYPQSEVLSTILQGAEREANGILRKKPTMAVLSQFCQLPKEREPEDLYRRFESILMTMISTGEIDRSSPVSPPANPSATYPFTSLADPAQSQEAAGSDLGIFPKGGGDVYYWPLKECAQLTVNAIARSVLNPKSPADGLLLVKAVGAKFANQSAIVRTGLLLKLRAPIIQGQVMPGSGFFWARVNEQGGHLFAEVFDDDVESFGRPVIATEITRSAIASIALMKRSQDGRRYLIVEADRGIF